MNEKPRFQRVTLDTPTYEKLGELAKRNNFTRAGYVRFLITRESRAGGGSPAGALAGKSIDSELGLEIDPVVAYKNGGPVRLSQLPAYKRMATLAVDAAGGTIDTSWLRNFLKLVLLMQPSEPDVGSE